MHNQLEIVLFGSPEVRLHGQPVTGFHSILARHFKAHTLGESLYANEAIMGLALMLLREGRLTEGVELLEFVQHNPGAEQESKINAGKRLAELAAEGVLPLTPPQRSIYEVVAGLLGEV